MMEVTLVQILSDAPKSRSWSDGITFRLTIVESTQAQRKAARKPVVNMNRFNALVALDGLPGQRASSVAKVFEEAFRLGLSVGEGNVSARQTRSLNDYTRELMATLKPSGLFRGDETPIYQTLQSIYRLGIWAVDS